MPVESSNLPEGWKKYVIQLKKPDGTSKWKVVFSHKSGKWFHTQSTIKSYIETENLSHDKKELKFKTDIGNALSAGSIFMIKLKLILHLQNHFDPSQLF